MLSAFAAAAAAVFPASGLLPGPVRGLDPHSAPLAHRAMEGGS